MIEELLSRGAKITAFDPEAMPNVKLNMVIKLHLLRHMYDALEDADALIISTEWSIFRTPDFNKLKEKLNNL